MVLRLDIWSPANFKSRFKDLTRTTAVGSTTPALAPTWIRNHARRVQAYALLDAYALNSARTWLSTDAPNRREHGDAALIVNQTLSALLGDTQRCLVVSTAGEGEAASPELQAELDKWVTDEQVIAKLLVAERQAVQSGDGVYVLGWDPKKNRTRLRTYHPGFYFPEEDPSGDSEFPSRVHLAWEYDDVTLSGEAITRIRRITYEVKEVPEREYPWGKSTEACFMTDQIWTLSELEGKATVENMGGRGLFRTMKLEEDLGIDFIPVVHVPNTLTGELFGTSVLLSVLQILDDIAAADTDLSLASATTGFPLVTLSGTRMGTAQPAYRPGSVWELGDGGRMDVLDTSKGLTAIGEYLQRLLERLAVNSRLPEAMLGRIEPGQVPSGLAFALAFAPLTSAIREMRLARESKHPLLLKFQYRIAQAAGAKDKTVQWPGGRIDLGAFLPTDTKETIDILVQLLDRKVISLPTAITIAKQAGIDIQSIVEEATRVIGEDFVGALALATALGGSEEAYQQAAKYLGRTPVTDFGSNVNQAPVPANPADPAANPADPAANN